MIYSSCKLFTVLTIWNSHVKWLLHLSRWWRSYKDGELRERKSQLTRLTLTIYFHFELQSLFQTRHQHYKECYINHDFRQLNLLKIKYKLLCKDGHDSDKSHICKRKIPVVNIWKKLFNLMHVAQNIVRILFCQLKHGI